MWRRRFTGWCVAALLSCLTLAASTYVVAQTGTPCSHEAVLPEYCPGNQGIGGNPRYIQCTDSAAQSAPECTYYKAVQTGPYACHLTDLGPWDCVKATIENTFTCAWYGQCQWHAATQQCSYDANGLRYTEYTTTDWYIQLDCK